MPNALALPLGACALTTLGALLGVACVHDLRERRIPNAVVAVTAGGGLARAALVPVLALAPAAGAAGAPTGALTSTLTAAALGVLCGLAAWLPLYALGVLGAGDVKLFAAAAAWLGPRGVLPASVYAAVAGGALALVWVARGRLAPPAAKGARDARLPYGIAVAAGVLAAAWGARRDAARRVAR